MEIHTLTEDEKKQKSLELAESIKELHDFVQEFELRFERFRCSQKELKERIDHLASVVRSGVEHR